MRDLTIAKLIVMFDQTVYGAQDTHFVLINQTSLKCS